MAVALVAEEAGVQVNLLGFDLDVAADVLIPLSDEPRRQASVEAAIRCTRAPSWRPICEEVAAGPRCAWALR